MFLKLKVNITGKNSEGNERERQWRYEKKRGEIYYRERGCVLTKTAEKVDRLKNKTTFETAKE